jgi:hypothetical protein
MFFTLFGRLYREKSGSPDASTIFVLPAWMESDFFHAASLLGNRRTPFVGDSQQGCQKVYFQTKNPALGNFWWVLQWKMLVYFMAIWPIF